MTTVERINSYIDAFERFKRQTQGSDPGWLHEIRKEAFAYVQSEGFPNTHQEEWRQTSVAPLLQRDFQLAAPDGRKISSATVADYRIDQLDAHTLVFINGRFDSALSQLGALPAGVRAQSVDAALAAEPERLEPYLARQGSYEGSSFAALNAAFLQDGAYIEIPKGTVLDKPIHFLYYTTPDSGRIASYPRNVVAAGESAQALIVESYAGPSGAEYFTDAVTEVSIGANAIVEHCRLQRESEKAFHVSSTQIHLNRGSQYRHHSIILGGGFVRNDVRSVLDGEGIHCVLNGLSMVDGERHVDNHTWIRHSYPNCESRELYKSILDGEGTGVFKGQIYVAKDAQKTDARQTNQTLLLSEKANNHSMPQLEIYADDVKCTHGSTTGRLDEESIFYLQSRGLNERASRSLLTYAFACEVAHQIGAEAIREQLDRLLLERLPMA